MDAFLAKVGTEFDPSFIKLHVGTDDLDELLEFTWERSDLSPLVDAGLKPLWRNKLYRAILEGRAARSQCVGAVDTNSSSSTGMPSSASLRDEKSEVPLSEIQDDASSVSQISEALTLQIASLVDVCASVDLGNDSSATPRSSQTSVPARSFEGFGSICGEYGHKISECKADSCKAVADFPALGVAGKRPVVPKATKDREHAMMEVARNGNHLQHLSKQLRGDRGVVLGAVAENGFALQYASKELRKDREVVLTAVARHGGALLSASKEFHEDLEVLRAAVAHSEWSLRCASQEMRDSRAVVLATVSKAGRELEWVSKRFRGDREVVLAAVAHDGSALQHASKELRGNRKVVLAAVATSSTALEFASNDLRDDREVVLAAVAHDGSALQHASVELLHAILTARPDVNLRFAVRSAASNGRTACLETLIGAKADVNERAHRQTPTLAASAGGNVACLNILIAARADVNAKSLDNDEVVRTPAMAAVVGGKVDCLNALIAAGACAHAQAFKGDDAQALADAATKAGNIECLNSLITVITAGAHWQARCACCGRTRWDVNAIGKLGHTLAIAATEGRVDCLNALLAARADLNAEGEDGPMPVAAAAKSGKVECLNVLIAARADLNAKGKDGLTPVAAAAKRGNTECLNVLIAARADLNAKCKDGLTPVAAAAKRGIECLNVLLAAGVDVNPRADWYQQKPVIAAIQAGKVECLDALLAAGADATARCARSGKTAAMEAVDHGDYWCYGRPGMLRLLIKSKTDVSAEDQDGRTALARARGREERYRGPRLDQLRECISILETAEAAAAAKVQLLTLHAADPNDAGCVTVIATSLGGDEVAQVQADLSSTMESVVAELQVELSPRGRRFMTADGRLLEKGDKRTTLRDWLLPSAE